MSSRIDETVLTSYALGEVTEEQARAIETRLETDEEARAFVEAQRGLAASLAEALGAEVGAGLDAPRRERVLGDGGARGVVGGIPFTAVRAAAVVAVCVSLGLVWASSLPERRRPASVTGSGEVALRDAAASGEGRESAASWRDLESVPARPEKTLARKRVEVDSDVIAEEKAEEVEETVHGLPSRCEGVPPVDVSVPDLQTAAPGKTETAKGIYGITAAEGTPVAPTPVFGRGGEYTGPQPRSRVLGIGGGSGGSGGKSPAAAPGGSGPAGTVHDRVISLLTHRQSGGVDTPGQGGAATGGRRPRAKSSPPASKMLKKKSLTGPGIERESLDREHREHRNRGKAPGAERYDRIVENDFIAPAGEDALSTLSIDVDTASYANVRRFLNAGRLPPPDAVRIEEMINYFNYDDPGPEEDGEPFAVTTEVAACPWNLPHRLMRIGIKAREIDMEGRAASNLVFLLDVSGSMNRPEKLPLLKQAMKMLVDSLDERDTVSIVVYAGSSGMVLPPTNGAQKGAILGALEQLRAGGSTNGEAGIEQAYSTAISNLVEGGNNRVIWCTDGDLNVGLSDQAGLVRLIQEKKESGVFLSVLGFGTGNIKDSTLEQIANKGDGAYSYIDGVREARKVLVEEMGGTLITVAKDVKIQVEFNPAVVAAYRLIGYENRLLAARDFNDDTKDAGEIGSGHSIVALYEFVPLGVASDVAPPVDPLRYQRTSEVVGGGAGEVGTVKLRFKRPDGDVSTKREFLVHDTSRGYAEASVDYKLAASVAAFGMILRASSHRGTASLAMIHELAGETLTRDAGGYRAELLDLIDRAARLTPTD